MFVPDAEMTEHLGYDKHETAGRGSGNSHDGTRSKTVFTEIGPVEIEVPRDLVRLPHGHSAPAVRDALINTFARLPAGLRKTLTWDQGNEMFHHERIEEAMLFDVYPRITWGQNRRRQVHQRGSGETSSGYGAE